MNWLPNIKVGDKFRWLHDGEVCQVTWLDDIDVGFVRVSGERVGSHGYTTLPQDIEPYGVLEQMAEILDNSAGTDQVYLALEPQWQETDKDQKGAAAKRPS